MIPDSPPVPAVCVHRAGLTVNMPQPSHSLRQADLMISVGSVGFHLTPRSQSTSLKPRMKITSKSYLGGLEGMDCFEE